MKIKNLADYPQQLADGRMIGAAGTKSDAREYGLDELDARDKKRSERGMLKVLEDEPTLAANDGNKTGEVSGGKDGKDNAKVTVQENPNGGSKINVK